MKNTQPKHHLVDRKKLVFVTVLGEFSKPRPSDLIEAIKSLGSNKKERDEYVLDGMEVVFNYEDFSKRMTLFFKKTWGDNI
jgi:hypothetical protein